MAEPRLRTLLPMDLRFPGLCPWISSLKDSNYTGKVSSLEAVGQRRILDVGCGIKKFPGSIGLDHNPRSNADLLCELDHFPWPLQDQCFDEIRLIHVIEHVGDVVRTVEECHRLLRPGGLLILETPHYTDFSSFCDPTHRWHLNSFSFRYFGEDNAGYGYYSEAKFSEEKVVVKLLSFWRWLGFELLVNQAKVFRKFWEHYLCFVVRGKVIRFELRRPAGAAILR